MSPNSPLPRLRYLALGDSYTIGESVGPGETFPAQLADCLRARGVQLDAPEIIARTDWTTDELDAEISRRAPRGPYDLVTLLIGVNNQYRGRSAVEYRGEFVELLKRAVGFAGKCPERVVVLSIPDWGMTSFGAGRANVSAEIDAFNAVNRDETAQLGAHYLDITPISRKAQRDLSLIADDGLHPSGKMYGEWVELLCAMAEGISRARNEQ